ncbi:MAG TPA: lipid IV(A) 3-deoxy-D-manno-octulosonic acid transferase [Burkholderiaceae bacterium]|jgi:3-deoxy-D-manno-octulosonic-acid transferase|nr:lipid IV(A) 3-deoxy-D-manno-octulosonic acid transferase [Burkholderiaceae bacterium]
MRLLYSAAWWLALPLVLARLWWRGRKEPGYRRHLAERLGFYHAVPFGRTACKTIWIHAVSVGETRAVEPLVDVLLTEYPGHTILLTHMTPTGRATGQTLFGRHAPRVVQCYLPYDTGWMTARFIRHFMPRLCVLMETEVWPNLIAQCTRHHVPVVLANARLSERSLQKARRLSGLMSEAARRFACVGAQTEADAARIRQLGAPDVRVTGSIKFDVTPPDAMLAKGEALRGQIGARPVLLCASTREGEEALILDALDRLDIADVLLAIVPRHPQRFDDVARMIASRGLRMFRRSQMDDQAVPNDVRILLGDSMGEMFAYYAACDVACIGGSLLPLGGQNLIEACALGKPVLIGPHTFNFSAVSEDAVAAGAAVRVADASAMLQEAACLLRDEGRRLAMGAHARDFAQRHRGAAERTMQILRPLIR